MTSKNLPRIRLELNGILNSLRDRSTKVCVILALIISHSSFAKEIEHVNVNIKLGEYMVKDIAQNLDVKLESNFIVSSDRIKVDYKFSNLSAKNIFLFDKQYNLVDGRAVVDESKCYTLLSDKKLILFRGVLVIPPYVQVEIPDMPYAQKVKPGESISTAFEIMYPVIYKNPYDWVEKEEVIAVKEYSLSLGYVISNDGILDKYEKVKIADQELYAFNYADIIGIQKLISSNLFTGKFHIVKKP